MTVAVPEIELLPMMNDVDPTVAVQLYTPDWSLTNELTMAVLV